MLGPLAVLVRMMTRAAAQWEFLDLLIFLSICDQLNVFR
jgi:hypothetical protein